MAGTGKSTMLRRFISDLGVSGKRVDITAPTGVAALNVGGMTIHRFCGMMLGPQAGQSNEDYFDVLRKDPRRSVVNGFQRVMRCQVLVIDGGLTTTTSEGGFGSSEGGFAPLPTAPPA